MSRLREESKALERASLEAMVRTTESNDSAVNAVNLETEAQALRRDKVSIGDK